jgi:hypothetical protein
MEMSGQLHTPAALPVGKSSPVPIGLEGGLAPEPVWTLWRRESLAMPGIKPGPSSPQPVVIPAELSRLSLLFRTHVRPPGLWANLNIQFLYISKHPVYWFWFKCKIKMNLLIDKRFVSFRKLGDCVTIRLMQYTKLNYWKLLKSPGSFLKERH